MKNGLIGYNALNRPVQAPGSKRIYHHHVIGSSGSGKSKFLEVLMREDLVSGQGFCLIDPHGTLYHDLLKFCAYRHLNREIILLNLSEPDEIIGFNFFSRNQAGDVAVQVDSRIQALLHAWGVENADQTPTLERILRLVFTSLLEADLTLPQITVLLDFSAKEIRSKVISQIENDLIRREWQELSDLPKARDFREETLSAKNRLFRLLTSNVLMRFLGVKGQTIDLLDAIEKQKVILINLGSSPHLSGENARVFGSLFVNQIFETAKQRRKDALGNPPRPWHLYLDEFQNFVSLDLCDALDEIRKFGVFLNLSHQRFGQLNEDIEDAILTNCRIKTVFGGLRTDDARRMAEELFIGKLDPKKIKASIYQLKHWYQYTRDKVYSKSSSRSESSGYSSGEGSGSGSGIASVTSSGQTYLPLGDEFFTGGMWLDNPQSMTESNSSSFSSLDSSSSFSSESYSSSYSESEGEADVPVFAPVPFQELSSVQYYTPEEQLLGLTQALKLNQQRHCFIQLPNQETQPLLVPLVKDFYISEESIKRYATQKAKNAGSISPEEADQRIAQDVKNLLSINLPEEVFETPEEKPLELESPTLLEKPSKKKKTIFDRLQKELQDYSD